MEYINSDTKRSFEIKDGRVVGYQENEEIVNMEESHFAIRLVRTWVDNINETWTDVYAYA